MYSAYPLTLVQSASTSQAYELFSHEADTGMVIPAASRLKNVEWDTQTTLFAWASQGLWPPEADGTEVDTTCYY